MTNLIVEVLTFTVLCFVTMGLLYNKAPDNGWHKFIWLTTLYLACAFVALSAGVFVSH